MPPQDLPSRALYGGRDRAGARSFLYAIGYRRGGSWLDGLALGGILAILASLPSALHLYAMVDNPASKQFLPVLWTTFSWGLTGAVIALVDRLGRE